MGINVFPVDSDNNNISNNEFVSEGFPSSDLRRFNMSGWIPYFDDLIGVNNLVDDFSRELRSADPKMLNKWYDNIVNNDRQDELISKYIKYCIDKNYTLMFCN